MNKRQRDCDVEMVENLDIAKKIRKDDICNMEEYSNDFEKIHLMYTNNEMARFVRSSVETIRRQQEEIVRLRKIIDNINT